jgi:hypothetical protein
MEPRQLQITAALRRLFPTLPRSAWPVGAAGRDHCSSLMPIHTLLPKSYKKGCRLQVAEIKGEWDERAFFYGGGGSG